MNKRYGLLRGLLNVGISETGPGNFWLLPTVEIRWTNRIKQLWSASFYCFNWQIYIHRYPYRNDNAAAYNGTLQIDYCEPKEQK